MNHKAIAMMLRDKLHPDVHAALFRILQAARDNVEDVSENIEEAVGRGQIECAEAMHADNLELADALVFFEEVKP